MILQEAYKKCVDDIIHQTELEVPSYKIHIIQEHENGEPFRKHKKKRIQKKWIKKYGCYSGLILQAHAIIEMSDGRILFMSRNTFNELKKSLRQKEGE